MSEQQAPGSETIIIRALFTNSAHLIKIASQLDVKDFTYKPYRIIYTAIKQLAASQTVINGESIMALLEQKVPNYYHDIQTVGGIQWVDSLYDATYESIVNLDEHVQSILQTAFNRRLYDAALRMAHLAVAEGTVDEKLSSAQQEIYNLMLVSTKQKEVPVVGHTVHDTIDGLINGDEAIKGISIAKYMPKFDAFIRRLQPGKVVLLNASSKAGKSTISIELAWILAGRMNIPVAYADSEMSERELHLRLLTKLTGYTQQQIDNTQFAKEHESILRQAGEYIFNAPIYRFDCSNMTEYEVETRVKLLQIQHGIKAFIWDYVKEIGSDGRIDKTLGNKIMVLKNRISNDCLIWCFSPMQRNPNTGKIADSHDPYRYADAVIRFDEIGVDEQGKINNLLATHKLVIEMARYLPKNGTVYLNIDLDRQIIQEV